MCFLLQLLLFLGGLLTALFVCIVLHAPFSLGICGAFVFLGSAWGGYLMYQAKHPDWWPPWDEGLPQSSRMLNAFVPVGIIFLLVLILLPIFQSAREKARLKQIKQEQQKAGSRDQVALPSRPQRLSFDERNSDTNIS